MALRIVEIHPADGPELLNSEWFVVENGGELPFNTRNCTLVVHKKGAGKKSELGTMDPGFVLAPGERVRVVTGHPGKKAHGEMPEGEPRSYNLFLGAPVLRGAGTVLTLALRSRALVSAEHDPAAPGGVKAA
jgi:hypothetical protein